jgi:hypothetical protein
MHKPNIDAGKTAGSTSYSFHQSLAAIELMELDANLSEGPRFEAKLDSFPGDFRREITVNCNLEEAMTNSF